MAAKSPRRRAPGRWYGCGAMTWSNSPWCSNRTNRCQSARRAFFAGMNAVADAIAAHCPPEREVSFDWPDAIRFDGGIARRRAARLAQRLRRGRRTGVAGVRRHPARRRHGACRGGAGRLRRFAAERRFRDDRHRCDHRQLRPPSDDRVRPLERARLRGDRAGLSGAASRSARPASAAASTSMAISWSACRPAAGRRSGPVLWMRSRKRHLV